MSILIRDYISELFKSFNSILPPDYITNLLKLIDINKININYSVNKIHYDNLKIYNNKLKLYYDKLNNTNTREQFIKYIKTLAKFQYLILINNNSKIIDNLKIITKQIKNLNTLLDNLIS